MYKKIFQKQFLVQRILSIVKLQMNFTEFVKLTFYAFGYDVDRKWTSNRLVTVILKIWQFLNPFIMIIGCAQLCINCSLLLNTGTVTDLSMLILTLNFFAQGFSGYFTIFAARTSSIKLIEKVEEIYQKITKNQRKLEDNQHVQRTFKFFLLFFKIALSSAFMNLTGGLMKIIVAMATNTQPETLSVMLLWFPEFMQDLWLLIAVFDPLVMLLFILSNLIVFQLVVISTVYLAASFDELGNKLKDAIKGSENKLFQEFAECIDLHSKLIKQANESNTIYGPSNLTFLVLISMKIGMIGIMVMVKNITVF